MRTDLMERQNQYQCLLKEYKDIPAQRTYSGCNNGKGVPSGPKEKQEAKEEEEPSSSANFSLYIDHDSYGLGYTCEPTSGELPWLTQNC